MRTQFRGLVFAVLATALIAALAGCGGSNSGDSGPGSGQITDTDSRTTNGITATARVVGTTVSVTAHTDANVGQMWATITGAPNGKVTLGGSNKDFSGSTSVVAEPLSIINIDVAGQDLVGGAVGPVSLQVRMPEFGAQPTIKGRVINQDTQTPIQGATVTLGGSTTAGQHVSTDVGGTFVFTDLIAGQTLDLVVTKSGFNEVHRTVTVTNGTQVLADVALSTSADQPPAPPVF